MSAPNFIAQGNIPIARFVMAYTAGNFSVVVNDGAHAVAGVSQEGVHGAPGTPFNDGYAAIAGETLRVYGVGDECLITVGTGGVTAGDLVMPDSGGTGTAVTATTPGGGTVAGWIGGQMLETGAVGELRRMRVLPQTYVT